MNRVFSLVFRINTCLLLLFVGSFVYAENINTDSSGNTSAQVERDSTTLNFDCTNCDATVTDSALTGAAWGESIGWITLNPTNEGVVNDGSGNLSGFAWGDVAGWVNFNPTNGGVTISDGKFSGTAWSENFGWIIFSCPGAGSTCVQTSWSETTTPSGGGSGGITSSGSYSTLSNLFTKKIKGCTDPNALNYNSQATNHDANLCVFAENTCSEAGVLAVSPQKIYIPFKGSEKLESYASATLTKDGVTNKVGFDIWGPSIDSKNPGIQKIFITHSPKEECQLITFVDVEVEEKQSEPKNTEKKDGGEGVFSLIKNIFEKEEPKDSLQEKEVVEGGGKDTLSESQTPPQKQSFIKRVLLNPIENIAKKVFRFFTGLF